MGARSPVSCRCARSGGASCGFAQTGSQREREGRMKATGLVTTLLALCAIHAPTHAHVQIAASPAEVRTIAEEAFLYAFPMVMNYGTVYAYFIDKASPEYKCPINQLYNTARVYTPKDTAIVTPNSDTPYSFVFMDLRAEPYVVTLPEI